ncbi:hypothetical protein [Psychroserpens sp. SPM9]|uniref:hypothetical protein n=1 Tax=Psychroserpens sp. SPM9 TaxID=2975598 RepID=UPI0021A2D49B|nr:hypothetical protein [Psychroserpens sp. SPM9]MDG5490574.1 hypothetical protein [Psychroserpens sp. SPM9]
MKKITLTIVISLLCAFTFIEAQTPFTKDSLSVSSIIGLNEKTNYKDYQVKFKNVISDSRCPKEVMCIRAGEAKVRLALYKNGAFISDKIIIIDASGYVIEDNNLAFNADDFKIYGMALTPYPKTTAAIPKKEYHLEIVFQPKRL